MDISSNKDLIRSHVITIILKSLQTDDKYGYEICKEIEDKTDGAYVLKQPTLYSCLKRLESQKYITSYWGEVSNGGRRKYYALTEQGKAFLNQDEKEWEYSRTLINRLLSDREFDLSSPAPFEASELRPYTKKATDLYNNMEDNSSTKDENINNESLRPTELPLTKEENQNTNQPISPITYHSNNTNQYIVNNADIKSEQAEEVENGNYLDVVENLIATSMNSTNNPEAIDVETENHLIQQIDTAPIANANSFNELQSKLYSKGYKLRCYSKTNSNTYYSMNFVYQNRLSALHLLLLAIILSLETFGIYFYMNSYINTPLNTYIYIAACTFVLPLFGLIRLLINPNRKKKADFDFKYTIINSLVIAFNLLLTAFVLGFLIFKIDFTNFSSLVLPIIIPAIVIINIPIAVVLYQIVYSTKKFHIR